MIHLRAFWGHELNCPPTVPGGWAKRRQSVREKWSQEGWETQGAERTKPGNVAKVLSRPHASEQRDLLRPPSAQCRLLPRRRTAHQPEGFGEGADLSCTPFPSVFSDLPAGREDARGLRQAGGEGSALGSAVGGSCAATSAGSKAHRMERTTSKTPGSRTHQRLQQL